MKKIFRAKEQSKKKLVFEVIGETTHKILLAPNEILYFERNRHKTEIHTVWGVYEVWDKIAEIEKMLSKWDFVRCHNSYIVFLPAVREMLSSGFIMENSKEISISRNNKKFALM